MRKSPPPQFSAQPQRFAFASTGKVMSGRTSVMKQRRCTRPGSKQMLSPKLPTAA
jgi:hypothetical protein